MGSNSRKVTKLSLEETNTVIRRGGLVAFCTESFYALGADATNPKAIAQIYKLKKRQKEKPIALIAANLKQVKKFFYLSPAEEQLAKKYWPGPLTILLRPKKSIAARALTGNSPPLRGGVRGGASGERPRIGVRVPAHAKARALALSVGTPITATSANLSRQPPTKSSSVLRRTFPGIMIVSGQCGRLKLPSTVIHVRKNNIHIIRPGAIHV